MQSLVGPASGQSSWNTAPASRGAVGGVVDVVPGNSYIVGNGPCAAGVTVGYEIGATGSLDLEYFQNSAAPVPIGLYVNVCGTS